jgi:hypothetical protein
VSIKISTRVWEYGPGDDGLLLTLLALADRMDDDGVTLPRFGGVQEIARRIRRSQRQANRNLKKLESEGWLTVERRTSAPGLRGAENRYRICLEKLSGESDTAVSHAHQRADDTVMSDPSPSAPDTVVSHAQRIGCDISSTEHMTSGGVGCDIAVSSHNRKNVERNYNSRTPRAFEAVDLIAQSEPSLGAEAVRRSIAEQLGAEVRKGFSLEDLIERMPDSWRKFCAARDSGKFEIRGWGAANFFGGGHWRDEQGWPWRAEYRPEAARRYVDPDTLYSGAEYQPRVRP